MIPGFGSIDHEIFSDFFTTFGPLQTPFVLPVSTYGNTDTNSGIDGNDESVKNGNINKHKNNNENENENENESERYRVSVPTRNANNTHTLLFVKFLMSMSIILVCCVLLLKLAQRVFLRWYNKSNIGSYQHLYVDVKIGENNDNIINNKNNNNNNNNNDNDISTEMSKFGNHGTSYGSINVGDINSREKYFIQSDRKIVAGIKKNKF